MGSQLPARPFIGRLMIEISKTAGGLPAAAAEMGINIDVIESLTKGVIPASEVLDTIETWLAGRTPLTQQEIQDLEQMKRSSPGRTSTQLERWAPREALGKLADPARQISLRSVAIICVVVLVVGVLAGIGIYSLVRPSSSASAEAQPSATASSPAPASASPTETSGSPVASPSRSPSAPASSRSSTIPAIAGIPSPSASPSGTTWSNQITVPDGEIDDQYKIISQPPVPSNTDSIDQGDIEVQLLNDGPGSDTLNNQDLDNGAQIAIWAESSAPTYQQCEEDASANGEDSQSIDNAGDQFCVLTSNGTVANLKLVSKDYGNNYATFQATIWWPASAGS